MTREGNSTIPMGLPARDPERTEPGAPPVDAHGAEKTDPGAPPDVASMTPVSKPPDNGTDPGLDPMLKAFNRQPRPPAPQPNLRASSDGDEFAAHYAPPRELAAPKQRPTAHDPGVLVQLAALARVDTAPHEPTPDPTIAVQRDIATVVGRKRDPRNRLRIWGITLAASVLVGSSVGLFVLRDRGVNASAGPSAAPDRASALAPLPGVPSSASAPVPSTSAQSTLPAVAASNPSPNLPTGAPEVRRPMSPPSARPATSDPQKPSPARPRPAHENPDTVL